MAHSLAIFRVVPVIMYAILVALWLYSIVSAYQHKLSTDLPQFMALVLIFVGAIWFGSVQSFSHFRFQS